MRQTEKDGCDADGYPSAEVVNQRLKRKAAKHQLFERAGNQKENQQVAEITRQHPCVGCLSGEVNRARRCFEADRKGKRRRADQRTEREVFQPAAMQLEADRAERPPFEPAGTDEGCNDGSGKRLYLRDERGKQTEARGRRRIWERLAREKAQRRDQLCQGCGDASDENDGKRERQKKQEHAPAGAQFFFVVDEDGDERIAKALRRAVRVIAHISDSMNHSSECQAIADDGQSVTWFSCRGDPLWSPQTRNWSPLKILYIAH